MGESPPTNPTKPTTADDFRLERLKHVLSQQRFLNEHSHKYVTIFQTTATAIVLAAVAVFMSWKSLAISLEVANAAIRALEILLLFVGAFVVLVVITNIASWWDYRKEEADLLNACLLYTSPSPRDLSTSRMPSSA